MLPTIQEKETIAEGAEDSLRIAEGKTLTWKTPSGTEQIKDIR
jgi:hypothetical protein